MEAVEITLIVTIYNEPIEKVLFSLKSILLQKEIQYEIIVADNGSDLDYEQTLTNFFRERFFNRFKLIKQPVNIGIVANVCAALNFAEGKYSKVLFTGDALYDEYTLRDVVLFLKAQDADLVFGDIVAFSEKRDEFYSLNIPGNKEAYIPGPHHGENGSLFSNMARRADYITGVALFWRTEILMEMETKLKDVFQVRFADDLATLLLLIERTSRVFYINRPVVFFEIGTGGSTKKKSRSNPNLTLYDDNVSMYKHLSSMRPYDMRLYSTRLMWAFKRSFVRLLPGIYETLRKRNWNRILRKHDLPSKVAFFFSQCGEVRDCSTVM